MKLRLSGLNLGSNKLNGTLDMFVFCLFVCLSVFNNDCNISFQNILVKM